FWQIDDRDGMEVSACGTGYRATINSYMYGEAKAIAHIALMSGEKLIADSFESKAIVLKNNLQQKLWDANAQFFKMLPRNAGAALCNWRELYGYTPWYFNMPDSQYAAAWKFLMDPKAFYAPYGPTTLEQSAPGFKISYQGHECQWNGPSWPYATSITLTAMANLLNNYSQPYISKTQYLRLFSIYTMSQQLKLDNGTVVPWIDENLNPFTGDWISRTRLKTWKNGTWSNDAGGEERGKDYNHSTYNDLIISGLIGLRPQAGDSLLINPLLPTNTWKYFCLDHVNYHGKTITILYDQTGKHYNCGKGFFVFVNGRKKAFANEVSKLKIAI
ncbi:MAG TPA: glycosyl hydrolase family 65 protein, partial [Mucilaginibacter sp.]|nr:glycosyl hydrolase family 65 protein [Mucilaginibacter sp.]